MTVNASPLVAGIDVAYNRKVLDAEQTIEPMVDPAEAEAVAGFANFTPPTESVEDARYAAIRAAVATFVPGVGTAISELIPFICAPPLSKRLEQWRVFVGEALVELFRRNRCVSAETLREDPEFVTAVLHATQIALKNHSQEKLEALRNAVVNTALKREPDADMQLMFLHLIDVLTPWHLRLLKLFCDLPVGCEAAGGWPEVQTTTPALYIIEHVFPELANDHRTLEEKLVRDLNQAGLCMIEHVHRPMPLMEYPRWTSFLGDRFLKFIAAQPESLASQLADNAE